MLTINQLRCCCISECSGGVGGGVGPQTAVGLQSCMYNLLELLSVIMF